MASQIEVISVGMVGAPGPAGANGTYPGPQEGFYYYTDFLSKEPTLGSPTTPPDGWEAFSSNVNSNFGFHNNYSSALVTSKHNGIARFYNYPSGYQTLGHRLSWADNLGNPVIPGTMRLRTRVAVADPGFAHPTTDGTLVVGSVQRSSHPFASDPKYLGVGFRWTTAAGAWDGFYGVNQPGVLQNTVSVGTIPSFVFADFVWFELTTTPAGLVTWRYSSDGVTWVTLASAVNVTSLFSASEWTSVAFELFAGFSLGTQPFSYAFDLAEYFMPFTRDNT